jgi:protein involved in polysaccharide export with SLBB domain
MKTIYRFLIGMLILSLVGEPVALQAQSQPKENSDKNTDSKTLPFSQQAIEKLQTEAASPRQTNILRISKVAFDAVIRSGRYVVGPGDAFVVVMDTGEKIETLDIPVGAGGDLVIPLVGAVTVAGLHLSQADSVIQKAIKNRFRQFDISVALSQLRTFPVTITGEVPFPGVYDVQGVERVSEIITKAKGLIDQPDRRASSRNIEIMHVENGHWQPSQRRADLLMWQRTGYENLNPFVVDGERIHVPICQDSISLSGAVRYPGNYEFAPGDRLSDLLMLGGGVLTFTDSATAHLLRLSDQTPVPINLPQVLSHNPEYNLSLQPGDKLHISGQTQWVYVTGAVHFPGPYTLTPGLRLKEILLQAQPTAQASLVQATLVRRVSKAQQSQKEIEDMRLATDRSITEEALMALDTERMLGRLPLDFIALIEHQDNSQNLILQDGDQIHIPQLVSSVQVYGAVINPANLPYNANFTVKDYVQQAGGFSRQARNKDIVIVQGSTGNAIGGALSQHLAPGDAIYVPINRTPPKDRYQVISETVSLATTVASLILTILIIRRN